MSPRLRSLRPALLFAAAVLVAGAVAGSQGRQPAAAAADTFPRAQLTIHKRDGQAVRLKVEVARTPGRRAQGLQGRRHLPARHGMLFVFPAPTRAGFWMKETLIPLSIAFVGCDGRILQIMDMEPCRADPCRVYRPRHAYLRALEVNRGAFRRWGVRPGDRVGPAR